MVDTKSLDAVSARLRYHKQHGKDLVRRAQETVLKKITVGSFLRYEEASSYYYQSAISFKMCKRWRQAGDSLVQCGKMHILAFMKLEAATLYMEAYEVYRKIDESEALRAIRMAISIYCEVGRFDIAGRLERKVAMAHYVSKHWEEAAVHFKKAANFLAGEQCLDQSDGCLEKAAICLLEIDEFAQAQNCFELIAEGCVRSNLRRFNARDYLLLAVLSMIAVPIPSLLLKNGKVDISTPVDGQSKYDAVIEKMAEYEKLDYMFRCSKEELFLKNIIKFRLAWEQDEFADHVYWWNNIRPLNRSAILCLRVISNEIQAEKDRRAEVRRQEELKRERERKRQEKLSIQKRLLEEMGMEANEEDIVIEDSDEENEKAEQDHKVQNEEEEGGGGADNDDEVDAGVGEDDDEKKDEEIFVDEFDDVEKPQRRKREKKGRK